MEARVGLLESQVVLFNVKVLDHASLRYWDTRLVAFHKSFKPVQSRVVSHWKGVGLRDLQSIVVFGVMILQTIVESSETHGHRLTLIVGCLRRAIR